MKLVFKERATRVVLPFVISGLFVEGERSMSAKLEIRTDKNGVHSIRRVKPRRVILKNPKNGELINRILAR